MASSTGRIRLGSLGSSLVDRFYQGLVRRVEQMEKEMAERFDGFILVDIETTGLIPSQGYILEVGMAHYNSKLEMQNVFSSLVLNKESLEFIQSKWDRGDFAYLMHDKSGLLADLDALGKPGYDTEPEEVARQAVEWLDQCGVHHSMHIPWTGNSVHFDAAWVTAHMPTLAQRFSYRHIDASGVREYVKVVAPDVFDKIEAELKPRGEHRVTPDILDSVDLLLALRKHGVLIS